MVVSVGDAVGAVETIDVVLAGMENCVLDVNLTTGPSWGWEEAHGAEMEGAGIRAENLAVNRAGLAGLRCWEHSSRESGGPSGVDCEAGNE